jgi:aminopeptidase
MGSFQRQFDAYAETTVRVGVNLQPNQALFIDASTDTAPFVRLLVEKAYQAGASDVHVEWRDPHVNKSRLLFASLPALSSFPAWKAGSRNEMAKAGAAFINVLTPQPVFYKEVPEERTAIAQRATQHGLSEYRQYAMSNKVSWCLVALASPEWADQVFPHLPVETRLSKLWETVFHVTRMDLDNPREAWEKHSARLQEKRHQLTNQQYRRLRFTAPGTDLTIDLPHKHIWHGGGATTQEGVFFLPNIPTEEVFTAPHRTGVNGVVQSTKPLYHGGQVIDNFSLEFKDGRIIHYQAEVGYETLKSILETDDGSHYLGEVALVPHSSPISKEGVTFYNTLYDENASCHIAIGASYPFTLEEGTTMSKDELLAHGMNVSLEHVDFMIGSAQLNIDALTCTGEWEPLFRGGEWVS